MIDIHSSYKLVYILFIAYVYSSRYDRKNECKQTSKQKVQLHCSDCRIINVCKWHKYRLSYLKKPAQKGRLVAELKYYGGSMI